MATKEVSAVGRAYKDHGRPSAVTIGPMGAQQCLSLTNNAHNFTERSTSHIIVFIVLGPLFL